jgi:predicted patatin/cPLA2 family phospholipase
MAHKRPHVGLVLTGGGARAAYQVGVLRAIAAMVPKGTPTPFDVLCGTSAGAITEFPADLRMLAAAEPVYETMPGWTQPSRGVTRFE